MISSVLGLKGMLKLLMMNRNTGNMENTHDDSQTQADKH